MSELSDKIKIVFLGTPEFACPFLEILASDSRFEVQMVITQEDKPTGRKMILTPSPVKQTALKLNLPIQQPVKLNKATELLDQLNQNRPDFFVVVAYGQILSQKVLNIPSVKAINVHGSILPKYRGASPIEQSLLNGDGETGLSIMEMALQMDAGAVFENIVTPILPEDNHLTLREKLSKMGAGQLPGILVQIKEGKLQARPQIESDATYCQKIAKQDGLIDPLIMTAESINNRFRAYLGWPGTYLIHQSKNVKLLDIKLTSDHSELPGTFTIENNRLFLRCQTGTIEILELQIEGKGPQKTAVFLNGNRQLFS